MRELDTKVFLKSFEGKSVDFFRFPGNYGDSLIWHGTKRLLSEFNISENYVDIASDKSNETLLIDGGGNLVDYYSDVRDFLIKKSSLYSQIIILPHTIFGQKQLDVLNSITSELVVFCREKVSARFLEKGLTNGKAYISQDCAFYNEFPPVESGEGSLNAFRTDKESDLKALPPSNNDISHNGYATKPLGGLLEILRQYEQINTDRLHIAIAGVLLNKIVKLYPNSYYKNKAVFDYSLKKFHNVSFQE